MAWFREFQDETGQWQTLDATEIELFRDDDPANRPDIPVSDPDNYYFVYWARFADGTILRRGGA